MTDISRRDLCIALPGLTVLGGSVLYASASQVHTSEFPAPRQSAPPANRTVPANDKPGAPTPPAAAGTLGATRVFAFDQMRVRSMANGAESRDIAHGTLATGETVNLHQSLQAVGAPPNPPHVIQHSEFILVREGEVEFQHEVDGQMVSERVGPGGAIYVAFGTKHAMRNVGNVPAQYFVVAIGGDAK